MRSNPQRVIIIGGGASGMLAAIFAARAGAIVTVLEQNEKPGKKLLATGNGRCNLTNAFQALHCYHSSTPEMVSEILEQFNQKRTMTFFHQLGISTRERDGWIYPITDQASSILDVLLMEMSFLKVKLKTNEKVIAIERIKEHLFSVQTEGWHYETEAVIVACGSPASSVKGASSDAERFAKQMDTTWIPQLPALVPIRLLGKHFSSWNGIRTEAAISMYDQSRELIARERGWLQLTAYGISGIPAFQISYLIAKATASSKDSVLLELDFMPSLSAEELALALEFRKRNTSYKNLYELLIGLIPDQLIRILLPQKQVKTISEAAERIKHFQCRADRTLSKNHAQVCSGGVSLTALNKHLESKIIPGLYFIGEALDVDGRCGGYNLQWAWSSGAIAGKAAAGVATASKLT